MSSHSDINHHEILLKFMLLFVVRVTRYGSALMLTKTFPASSKNKNSLCALMMSFHQNKFNKTFYNDVIKTSYNLPLSEKLCRTKFVIKFVKKWIFTPAIYEQRYIALMFFISRL